MTPDTTGFRPVELNFSLTLRLLTVALLKRRKQPTEVGGWFRSFLPGACPLNPAREARRRVQEVPLVEKI